jgi:hypothetical protein
MKILNASSESILFRLATHHKVPFTVTGAEMAKPQKGNSFQFSPPCLCMAQGKAPKLN